MFGISTYREFGARSAKFFIRGGGITISSEPTIASTGMSRLARDSGVGLILLVEVIFGFLGGFKLAIC